MTLITTLARLEAVRTGRAQPAATVRHRHLSDRPLVFVPLVTAGEAGAPLGALVGTDRDAPHLLVVPQPRDRDLRFAFLADLADIVLPHIETYAESVEAAERTETDPETGKRVKVEVDLCADAAQLVVPSRAGVDFVRLLGRSMRFRRTAEQDPETPYPAPPRVPLLGRWLTHYGERARVPGSSLLLAMTDLLGSALGDRADPRWRTSTWGPCSRGSRRSSRAEPGLTGAEAARRAELGPRRRRPAAVARPRARRPTRPSTTSCSPPPSSATTAPAPRWRPPRTAWRPTSGWARSPPPSGRSAHWSTAGPGPPGTRWAGPGPAAGAARRGARRGALDPRPLVVHLPPRPRPGR